MNSTINRPGAPSLLPTPLVERDEALRTFEGVLCPTTARSAPRSRIVFVEGDPGVGVSALLNRALATAAGWQIVAIRCDAAGDRAPRSILDLAVDALQLLPGEGDPARDRSNPVGAAGDLITQVARETPLLVAVDDAQHADEPSLEVLATAWANNADLPITLLVGSRPPAGSQAGLHRLRAMADQVIVVPPLSLSGSAQLLDQQGVSIPDDALQAVHLLTGGRPAELDLLVGARGRSGEEPVGTTHAAVRPLVARRLASLSPDARRAIEVVAVLETVAGAAQLGAIAECPRRAEAVLVDLRAVGLLAPDQPVRCACSVIAELVRATVPEAVAGEIRRAALTAELDAGGGSDVLVPLAVACPPAGDPVVVDLLAAASDVAIRSNQPEEALRLVRRALIEPPQPERELDLRGRLALASALANEPGSPALVRRVFAQLDDVAGAHLARRASAILGGHGRSREATTMIDDLVRSQPSARPEVASILEMGWIAAAKLDVSMRPAILRRVAEAAARQTFDPSPSGRALAGLVAYELSLVGENRARVVELARFAVDLDTGGSLTADMPSIWSAVLALQFAGELDAAASTLDRLERRGIDRARQTDVLAAHHLRTTVDRHRGHLTSAERSATEVATALRSGWRTLVPGAAGNRCRLAMLAGDLDRAATEIELPGGVERYADDPTMVEFLDARGQLRFRLGRYAEALEDHLRVRDRHESLGALNPATMVWSQGASRAMAALGRRAEALELLDEQLGRARTWGAPRAIGMLLTTAGVLQTGRAGDALLHEAVEALDRGGTPIELAEAHIAVARAAQGRGDDRKAERAARLAESLADRSGAPAIGHDARAVLRDLGDPGPASDGVDRLTPAELRAARLASGGATNAEIAAELYVTRKAVEYHLSNVYRKLGVSGRSDLRGALGSADPDDGTG